MTEIRIRDKCIHCKDGFVADPTGLWREFSRWENEWEKEHDWAAVCARDPTDQEQAEREKDRAVWWEQRGFRWWVKNEKHNLPAEEEQCEYCEGRTYIEKWMSVEEFMESFIRTDARL